MKAKRKLVLAFGAILLAALLFVPWKHTIAPATRVQVFDEAGNPATHVGVEQEWEYFAIGSERQRDVSQTDSGGYVSFPARSVRISVARQTLSFARSLRPHGHEFGPYASIEAHGLDPRAWDIVLCGINNPAPRPLRLKRWDLAIQ
jgi:hypothetical protein